jgi:hypothetical protein
LPRKVPRSLPPSESRFEKEVTLITPKQFNCLWTIKNLPDSAKLRRQLLIGVTRTLSPADSVFMAAREMLAHMDAFDAQQKSLPLDFSGDGDGDGNGKGDGK